MPPHVEPPGGGVPRDRADLWLARVEDAPPPAPAWLAECLSEEERARARAFHRPADAHLFTLAHGLLRAALSHYLGGPPGAWRFAAAPGGKPLLAEPPPTPLHFNLSHAPGLVAALFCAAGPVGVDVEPLARAAEVRGLIDTQFHPDEWSWLAAGDAAERDRRAVRLWTAHEALLKAAGTGMAVPSREIAVEWGADERPRVVVAPAAFLEASALEATALEATALKATALKATAGGAWCLIPFAAGATHVGCCALPREGLRLVTRAWLPAEPVPPATA